MSVKKILVVDDTPMYLDQITQILTAQSFEVITATTGKDAFEKAKINRPDLIFMDIIMPDMDGFAACRQLTKDCVTKEIPITFVSSKDSEADRVWAELQGAKGYITKPYTAEQILAQVEIFN